MKLLQGGKKKKRENALRATRRQTPSLSEFRKQKQHRARFLDGTDLRRVPVFTVGCLSLEHTLCPCRDVSCAVVGVALEHELTLTRLARLQRAESHAVC